MAKKSFLIIGMGTFGHHLCRELANQRCEVMVVDIKPEAVEDVLGIVVSAKVGDCTNEEVLSSFGIPDFTPALSVSAATSKTASRSRAF